MAERATTRGAMADRRFRYRLRTGRPSDADALADLQAAVQLQAVTGGRPHPGIAARVHDMFDRHPGVGPGDFLVAEDLESVRPAASLVGIRQDWSLGGARLPVAQIELVGALPEHRGNRLTERLLTALHEKYAAEHVPLQMIEGIPYFYRRFGYDYALVNAGAPTVPATALPAGGAADPDAPHHTMTLDLYGRAARLEFTDGELTAVTAVPGVTGPAGDPAAHAAIPRARSCVWLSGTAPCPRCWTPGRTACRATV